ncbi:hypothetical protein [Brucella anthropi]|jgi:hypothetical protein|uniref:hypothetical protein n=1 Tax=Brucella anthropi TaxID=529 RepID=UPI001CFC4E54|nr:hypothetical protein [Brucella anthropi]
MQLADTLGDQAAIYTHRTTSILNGILQYSQLIFSNHVEASRLFICDDAGNYKYAIYGEFSFEEGKRIALNLPTADKYLDGLRCSSLCYDAYKSYAGFSAEEAEQSLIYKFKVERPGNSGFRTGALYNIRGFGIEEAPYESHLEFPKRIRWAAKSGDVKKPVLDTGFQF